MYSKRFTNNYSRRQPKVVRDCFWVAQSRSESPVFWFSPSRLITWMSAHSCKMSPEKIMCANLLRLWFSFRTTLEQSQVSHKRRRIGRTAAEYLQQHKTKKATAPPLSLTASYSKRQAVTTNGGEPWRGGSYCAKVEAWRRVRTSGGVSRHPLPKKIPKFLASSAELNEGAPRGLQATDLLDVNASRSPVSYHIANMFPALSRPPWSLHLRALSGLSYPYIFPS